MKLTENDIKSEPNQLFIKLIPDTPENFYKLRKQILSNQEKAEKCKHYHSEECIETYNKLFKKHDVLQQKLAKVEDFVYNYDVPDYGFAWHLQLMEILKHA